MTKEREKGFLSLEEWKTVIYYIYDQVDAQFLEEKIMEFIKRKLESVEIKQPNKRLTREEINKMYTVKEDLKIWFKDFIKIVMDYQIKLRDRYLKNFVVVFKKYDSDNDGVINEQEFFEILSFFGYYKENIELETERLLNIADPFNNQRLTFSECITLFSNEIITDFNEKGDEIQTSLLDKISTDNNLNS